MGLEALKLELIEWLTRLENQSTIEYLKVVKDGSEEQKDWWNDLSDLQKAGVERGLKDIENGWTSSHDAVKEKYWL
ncbi:MAG: hypothetical protein K9G46_11820 [Flavobacteriales bacterium]|jgi:hypothetical protein|nr:hypothetical protein [Flavobacteriales bacterium]